MTPNPITIGREVPRRRSAQDHGNAQDHVGRRRRRARIRRGRRAPARSLAHADVLTTMAGRDEGRTRPAPALRRRRRPDRRRRRHPSGRDRVEGVPHPRRGGDRLGAAGRVHRGAALGADIRARRPTARHSWRRNRRPRGCPTSSGIRGDPRAAGPSGRRSRVHGGRPARPAGARRGRAFRPPRPTRRRSAYAVDWVSHLPGAAGAVRELIELVLRAQERWDAVVRELLRAGLMESYVVLLTALVALLVGLDDRQGVGTLQAAGRPLDRSPPGARVPPLHARAQLPRRQPDRSGDRRTGEGRAVRGRPARDSSDPRQSLSREGSGRHARSRSTRRCCSGRIYASSNTPTCCSASVSTTSTAASSIARSRRSPKCCGSIATTSTR